MATGSVGTTVPAAAARLAGSLAFGVAGVDAGLDSLTRRAAPTPGSSLSGDVTLHPPVSPFSAECWTCDCRRRRSGKCPRDRCQTRDPLPATARAELDEQLVQLVERL